MIEIVPIDQLVPDEILAMVDDAALIGILYDLGAMAFDHWQKQALTKVQGRRARDYIQSIQNPELNSMQVTVALVGSYANQIENGQPELDMHDTLLGPNVPVVAKGQGRGKQKGPYGYYRAVPFRHATPGTGGAVGQAMGSAYTKQMGEKAAAALGKKVYNAAKKLKATTSQPGQGTAYGGRLGAGLAPILQTYAKNKEHKTDIYAGMIKSQKTYEKATQSQYMTFRMISENPATRPSWIRPPVPGVHLAKAVTAHMTKKAPKVFEAYLASLGD